MARHGIVLVDLATSLQIIAAYKNQGLVSDEIFQSLLTNKKQGKVNWLHTINIFLSQPCLPLYAEIHKYFFSLWRTKKFKTCRSPYSGLDLSIHVIISPAFSRDSLFNFIIIPRRVSNSDLFLYYPFIRKTNKPSHCIIFYHDVFVVNFLNIVCWIQRRVDDKIRHFYTLGLYYDFKKNFLIYIQGFRREQLQSHIWLTASSWININFSYMTFSTDPIWISLCMRKISFPFFISAKFSPIDRFMNNYKSCWLFDHFPSEADYSATLSSIGNFKNYWTRWPA